ncbi:MAG TPA: hypothetical protein VF782_06725 [Allosphingosinicella sp.]|jgi:hypothetical protein
MGDLPLDLKTAVRYVGLLTFLAYVYSYAFLFAVEPKFVPAFSPLDLILWATTALWVLVSVALALALVAMLPLAQFLNFRGYAGSGGRYRRAARLRRWQPYLHAASVVGPVLFVMAVLAALARYGERQPLLAQLHVLLTPILFMLMFPYIREGSLWRVSRRFVRRLAFALVLLFVFLAGDFHAFRLRYFPHADDPRLCRQADSPQPCERLLFLGSNAYVAASKTGVVLRQRNDELEIRASGASPYLLRPPAGVDSRR